MLFRFFCELIDFRILKCDFTEFLVGDSLTEYALRSRIGMGQGVKDKQRQPEHSLHRKAYRQKTVGT